MNKSVIASVLISSIAWMGLSEVSSSFAQSPPPGDLRPSNPTADPGQSPLPGGASQPIPTSEPVAVPTSTPEASSAPDAMKKPGTNKKPVSKKSSPLKKKKVSATINPRLP